jgi:hypothetical protein
MPSLLRAGLQREPAVLDETALRQMMRDPRYWHPTSRDPVYQREVEAGFRRLYPGPARLDATGRQYRPWDNLQDRPRTAAGGPVHVDAYSRQRDGQREQVRQHYRAQPGSGGGRRELPPPDQVPATPQNLYRRLDFDPHGPGEMDHARQHPLDAAKALALSKAASIAAQDAAGDAGAHNNKWDAYRHAHWSFEMTRILGYERAKQFGDGHEVSDPNDDGERMMDLYNNEVGRQLALDPANRLRFPDTVIREAMSKGLLRTSRF